MVASSNAGQADFWNAQPGQNWATHQQDLDIMHEGVTALIMEAAAPSAGDEVLDVGCGAGASTFAFAGAVAPTGRVDGVDISIPLVEKARQRQKELGIANTRFTVADAQDHALGRAAYDMAVSRFGLMFFSDTVAAFRNIGTAIRPGGRFVFAAWAGPEHNPWFTVPQQAAVARLGPPETTPPPDAPGPLAFRDTGRVLAMMTEAGFREAACTGEDADLHHPGGLDAIMRLVPHVGPIARMLRDKNGAEEDRVAILDAVAADFAPFETSDGMRVPARVNVFSGRAA